MLLFSGNSLQGLTSCWRTVAISRLSRAPSIPTHFPHSHISARLKCSL
jgi:hypothetical protein